MRDPETTITIETCYSSVTISVPQDDMSFSDIMEQLIEPALLGIGFSRKLIDDYFNEESTA